VDVLNQVSPVPRKLVETFKHKTDYFSGSFKDDLEARVTFPLAEVPSLAPKAALKILCPKLAPNISFWVGAGVTITLNLPLNLNVTKMFKTAA
jgi:hypothetical protein